jgi:hypothetical protein
MLVEKRQAIDVLDLGHAFSIDGRLPLEIVQQSAPKAWIAKAAMPGSPNLELVGTAFGPLVKEIVHVTVWTPEFLLIEKL